MTKLIVSQDWTGSAPVHAAWNCVDDDHDLGRPVGHGPTAEAAVTDYLQQCDDGEVDYLWWEAKVSGEWWDLINAENEARAALDPFHQLDYYNADPREEPR